MGLVNLMFECEAGSDTFCRVEFNNCMICLSVVELSSYVVLDPPSSDVLRIYCATEAMLSTLAMELTEGVSHQGGILWFDDRNYPEHLAYHSAP